MIFAGSALLNEIPTPEAVPGPTLMTVTNAVAAVPTTTERLPGKTAATKKGLVDSAPDSKGIDKIRGITLLGNPRREKREGRLTRLSGFIHHLKRRVLPLATRVVKDRAMNSTLLLACHRITMPGFCNSLFATVQHSY